MTCLSFGGGQAIEKCQARNNSRHCALLNTEILSVCLSILLVGFFLIHSPNACSHSTRVMASLEKHSESSSTGLSRVSETIKKFGGAGTFQGTDYVGNTVSAKAKRFERIAKGQRGYMEQREEERKAKEQKEKLLQETKTTSIQDKLEKFGGAVKRDNSETNAENIPKIEEKTLPTVKELTKKFANNTTVKHP